MYQQPYHSLVKLQISKNYCCISVNVTEFITDSVLSIHYLRCKNNQEAPPYKSKTHLLGLAVHNFKTKLPYKYKCQIILSNPIFRPEIVNSYSQYNYNYYLYPLKHALCEAHAQNYVSQQVLIKAEQHIHC